MDSLAIVMLWMTGPIVPPIVLYKVSPEVAPCSSNPSPRPAAILHRINFPSPSSPPVHVAPPLSARTRCSVAPPSRLYSFAVLSSALSIRRCRQRLPYLHKRSTAPEHSREGSSAHLLAAEDEPLLHRRDPLLLLHSLFDARDLWAIGSN